MKKLILIASLAGVLGACSPVATDPETGPVIIQCDGENVVRAFGTTRTAKRLTFRVDGRADTFEVWNAETGKFATWGDAGDLTIEPGQITYSATLTSDGASANRMIRFDRVAGTVEDNISVQPVGRTSFSGTCEAVRGPSEAKTKF